MNKLDIRKMINEALKPLNEASSINLTSLEKISTLTVKGSNAPLNSWSLRDTRWNTVYHDALNNSLKTEDFYYIIARHENKTEYLVYTGDGSNEKRFFHHTTAQIDYTKLAFVDNKDIASLFTNEDVVAVVNTLRKNSTYKQYDFKKELASDEDKESTLTSSADLIASAYWIAYSKAGLQGRFELVDGKLTNEQQDAVAFLNRVKKIVNIILQDADKLVGLYIWELLKFIKENYDNKNGFILNDKSLNYINDLLADGEITLEKVYKRNTFKGVFIFNQSLYEVGNYNDIISLFNYYDSVLRGSYNNKIENKNVANYLKDKEVGLRLLAKNLILTDAEDSLTNLLSDENVKLPDIRIRDYQNYKFRKVTDVENLINKMCQATEVNSREDIEENLKFVFKTEKEDSVLLDTTFEDDEAIVEDSKENLVFKKGNRSTLALIKGDYISDLTKDNILVLAVNKVLRLENDESKKANELFTIADKDIRAKEDFVLHIKKLVFNVKTKQVTEFEFETVLNNSGTQDNTETTTETGTTTVSNQENSEAENSQATEGSVHASETVDTNQDEQTVTANEDWNWKTFISLINRVDNAVKNNSDKPNLITRYQKDLNRYLTRVKDDVTDGDKLVIKNYIKRTVSNETIAVLTKFFKF